MKIIGIVQANYLGWDGNKDFSLKKVNGDYVIGAVIRKLKSMDAIGEITIAVPDLPGNRIFGKIARDNGVRCFYGPESNVLERLIGASESIGGDVIVKVLGEHYFFDRGLLENMVRHLLDNGHDYVQAPDDFDCKLSGEVFTHEALLRARPLINAAGSDSERYLIRPLTFIRESRDSFDVGIFEEVPRYSDDEMLHMREITKSIISSRYDFKEGKGSELGDFNRVRYVAILPQIKPDDLVLDIACGSGYGSALLAGCCREVVGADIDRELIARNQKDNKIANVTYAYGDATQLDYEDGRFDAVVSMETIEHIEDDSRFVAEMHRVLKNGGTFIVSTPQNRFGSLPLNYWHVREYGKEQFRQKLEEQFEVSKILVGKRGIITEDGDGDNMIAICKKK